MGVDWARNELKIARDKATMKIRIVQLYPGTDNKERGVGINEKLVNSYRYRLSRSTDLLLILLRTSFTS